MPRRNNITQNDGSVIQGIQIWPSQEVMCGPCRRLFSTSTISNHFYKCDNAKAYVAEQKLLDGTSDEDEAKVRELEERLEEARETSKRNMRMRNEAARAKALQQEDEEEDEEDTRPTKKARQGTHSGRKRTQRRKQSTHEDEAEDEEERVDEDDHAAGDEEGDEKEGKEEDEDNKEEEESEEEDEKEDKEENEDNREEEEDESAGEGGHPTVEASKGSCKKKYTVVDLKKMLRAHGIQPGRGRKDTLVDQAVESGAYSAWVAGLEDDAVQ